MKLFLIFIFIVLKSIVFCANKTQIDQVDNQFHTGVFKVKKVIGYLSDDINNVSDCDYQKEYRITKDSSLYINRCDHDWNALQKVKVKTEREYLYGKINKTTVPSRYTCGQFYLIFSKYGLVIIFADFIDMPETKTIITEKIK